MTPRGATTVGASRASCARITRAATIGAVTILAACSTTPGKRSVEPAARGNPTTAPGVASNPPRKGGGYYLDDGPGESPPANLDLLPDAVPRIEKFASGANRPYNVFGVEYVPDLSGAPYRQRGVGSWYGRKFHGLRTSSGEIYDMYAMTAAHPTLPIPCYALVTNVQNGKSVIVRVNDRGPFLHNRVMDLSYAAALKLGYLSSGSGLIEVEMLRPADIAAGRIPVTSNSLYVAAAAANGVRAGGPVPIVASNGAVASPSPSGWPVASATATGVPGAPATRSSDAPDIAPDIASFDPTRSPVARPIAPPNGPDRPSVALLAAVPQPRSTPGASAMRSPETSDSIDASALPASYAARGIPADLIPDAEPPAKLPETATASGFYLQLGAFRARAGADSFAAHVTREIDPAIAAKVHVSDANGLFRVRIGPYAARAEADGAASGLRAAIAQPVLVMPEGMLR